MTPISDDIEEYIEKRVELDRLLAGSKFEFDEAGKRLTRNEALDRCDDRAGQARHGRAFMLGIEESAYNIHVQNLRHLDLPTMVIQAGEDELFDPDHGEELAGLIPGAKYKVFDGLGHELPNGIWPSLVGAVVELTTERMV